MNGVLGLTTNAGLGAIIIDAVSVANTHIDSIEVKIKKLDTELLRLREELANCNHGPAKLAIQDWSIHILRQKQQCEALLEQQSFNMEGVGLSTEKLRNAMVAMDAMEIAKNESQEGRGRLHDQVNKVQEVVSRSYNVPDEINEEDLQAELDALSSYTETSYLDEVVSQPIHLDLGQNGLKFKHNRSEPAGMVVTTDS